MIASDLLLIVIVVRCVFTRLSFSFDRRVYFGPFKRIIEDVCYGDLSGRFSLLIRSYWFVVHVG